MPRALSLSFSCDRAVYYDGLDNFQDLFIELQLNNTEITNITNRFPSLQPTEEYAKSWPSEQLGFTMTPELKEKALALLEGYKSSHYSKFKKHNIAIEDILGIMELLMFASKENMYAFDITEAKYFFDDLGGFISKGDHHVINKKFSPSALMYQYFLYIENEENLDKYYSRKMNATEIAELQEKVLYELIRELHQQEYLIETQFIPKQKEKILRMLNIAKELYPSEIKKILNAYLDYLWDQEALTRIEVIDKNNILTLKLNILTDLVSNELNYYNRAEIIDNFMHGGLIIGFLGTCRFFRFGT